MLRGIRDSFQVSLQVNNMFGLVLGVSNMISSHWDTTYIEVLSPGKSVSHSARLLEACLMVTCLYERENCAFL